MKTPPQPNWYEPPARARKESGSFTALDLALQHLFGAHANEIQVTHLDHLCITLTPEKVTSLLTAAGGAWAGILKRIQAAQDERKSAKSPGVDTRNT